MDKIREEFEEWASTKPYCLYRIDDAYKYMATQQAWLGWQASYYGRNEAGALKMTSWDKQVGGDHYTKMKLQPLQLAYLVAGGDSCFCKVAKYIGRTKNKDDKEKAIDVLEKAKTLRKSGVEVTHYKRKMIGEFADQFDNAPTIAAILITFLEARYSDSIKYVEGL